MKKGLIFFFAIIILPCSLYAETFDGLWLRNTCAHLGSTAPVYSFDNIACTCYVAGVMDGLLRSADNEASIVNNTNFRNALNNWYKKYSSVSALEYALIVRRYILTHPEQLHYSGAVLIRAAVFQAFPIN